MNGFVSAVGGILMVELIAFGLHACLWPQTRRTRLVHSFAADRRLVLDPHAARLAERLLIAVRRGQFLGTTLGIAGVGATWWATRSSATGVSVGAGLIVGMALLPMIPQVAGTAGAVLASRNAAPSVGDRRVAHLRARSLEDLLPPLMRWYPVALLAASGVAVAGAILAGRASAPGAFAIGRRGMVAGWVACLVAVVVTELASRLVIAVPRTAASPAALAVQDEIASDLAVVVVHGALGSGLLLGVLASGIAPAAVVAGCWAGIVPAFVEHRRKRRVRERLWEVPAARPHRIPTPPDAVS